MTTAPPRSGLPEDFLWGIGRTSWRMMEGEQPVDGGGLSVQHTYARTPGNGPAERGVDHDRPVHEDIQLMRELGVGSCRFDIAWAQVLPNGTGRIDPRGLDHYEAMVDALLEAGITPFPYLYTWDLPAALQDRGGWANRDCADWFAEYADVVFQRLGDRIRHWLTICEPWSIVQFCYLVGADAPGICDVRTAARAGHHLLLGHGRAVQAFRAAATGGEIGLSTVWTGIRPASDAPEDVAAAARADRFINRLYLDPVLLGRYPDQIPERLREFWPEQGEDDLSVISTPIDFLGVVYYMGMPVSAAGGADDPADQAGESPGDEPDDDGPPVDPSTARHAAVFGELLDIVPAEPSHPSTEIGWEIYPDGLTNALVTIDERSNGLPLYVAETGATFPDPVGADGVHDADRTAYLRDHVLAAQRAVEAGVDLRGLNVFGLTDDADFRFGLVHVDRDTGARTMKDSGAWYRDVIAANGI